MLRADKPAWVSAEATPNHLFLNIADYASLGTLVQMNPPIRETSDCDALWEGLRSGAHDVRIAVDEQELSQLLGRAPDPERADGEGCV